MPSGLEQRADEPLLFHYSPWHILDNVVVLGRIGAAFAAARTAGQPLALDWYADWCISCKVMEREVFVAPQVAAALARFRLVRFDLTAGTPEQRALLDRYRLFGPPALLLFAADGSEQADLRVIGETDAATLAARLEQAGQRR